MATRKDKAFTLLERAMRGPQGTLGFPHGDFSPTTWREADKASKDSYRIWSETWVLPLILELVPEFRGFTDPAAALSGIGVK